MRVLWAILFGVAACEPSGPGEFTATVMAPVPTGAAVVEIAGRTIRGFEGLGDVSTFAVSSAVGDSIHRVILVSPSGGELRFAIRVEDVGGVPPRAVVVSAADPSNQPILGLAGYAVLVAR